MSHPDSNALAFLIVSIVLLILFVIAIAYVLDQSRIYEESVARKRLRLSANESKSVMTLARNEYLKRLTILPTVDGELTITRTSSDEISSDVLDLSAGNLTWVEFSGPQVMRLTEVIMRSTSNVDLTIDMHVIISKMVSS